MNLVIDMLDQSRFPEFFEWDEVAEQFIGRLKHMVRTDVVFTRDEEFEELCRVIEAALGQAEFVPEPRRSWHYNHSLLVIVAWLNSLPQWPKTSAPALDIDVQIPSFLRKNKNRN